MAQSTFCLLCSPKIDTVVLDISDPELSWNTVALILAAMLLVVILLLSLSLKRLMAMTPARVESGAKMKREIVTF